jgi:ABC-type nitrate/sulfonate/bicarbonate transport system permease component
MRGADGAAALAGGEGRASPASLRSRRLLRVAAVLLFLLVWEGVVRILYGGQDVAVLLPGPVQVFRTMGELLVTGELIHHTVDSLLRVLAGYWIAVAVAVPLGFVIGWWWLASDMGEIIIEMFRPVPPLAWIPLAVLWFGLGSKAAIFIIFIGAFFPTLVATVAGVRSVERGLLEAAYTLGATRSIDIFRKVILLAALPSIFTGLRISVGLSWMGVVAAEMVAIDNGLGYLIMDARRMFRPDVVVVGMIAIGVVGVTMDLVARKSEGWALRWRRTGHDG